VGQSYKCYHTRAELADRRILPLAVMFQLALLVEDICSVLL